MLLKLRPTAKAVPDSTATRPNPGLLSSRLCSPRKTPKTRPRNYAGLDTWQFLDHHGRINEIRFRWLEGRLEAGFRRYAQAEAIFREVKAAFVEVERAYHAALVSLDLSAALLARGKAGEAEDVVKEAAKIFAALQIEREALAAVIMLRGSFEVGLATASLAEEVAAFVRRAAHDPEAVFDPERWG